MKQRTLQLAVLITSAIALAGFAQNAIAKTAVSACTTSFAACGCTITRAGSYKVTGALTMTGIATPDCIDISAAKVNLQTNANAITGTGTGVGINILKSATNA